jgi:hypothetical protein
MKHLSFTPKRLRQIKRVDGKSFPGVCCRESFLYRCRRGLQLLVLPGAQGEEEENT